MTTTYDCIATTTLGSSASSITFSSISASYTDLMLVLEGGPITVNVAFDVYLRMNSDTSSNYSDTRYMSNFTDQLSNFSSGIRIGQWRNVERNSTITHLLNYSNATTFKTILSQDGKTQDNVGQYVGLWRSTAAINEVTLAGSNFPSGTTATIYGIKAE